MRIFCAFDFGTDLSLSNMTSTTQTFFNLPAREGNVSSAGGEVDYFSPPAKYNLQTSWRTLQDQAITRTSVLDVFANRVPVLREKSFLSAAECARMLEIVALHEIVSGFILLYHVTLFFHGVTGDRVI
jgi:hypothetical protein